MDARIYAAVSARIFTDKTGKFRQKSWPRKHAFTGAYCGEARRDSDSGLHAEARGKMGRLAADGRSEAYWPGPNGTNRG